MILSETLCINMFSIFFHNTTIVVFYIEFNNMPNRYLNKGHLKIVFIYNNYTRIMEFFTY